ncbi:MAG: IMP cyclohydrolase [Victivallaceae bacterium]|nr:IMP cyclohydrolase [Victivallaceae bacterium]
MYIGRIVGIGLTKLGKTTALYRVSSRSFPNRRAVEHDGMVAIVPRPGAEGDLAKNPYISYNCLRVAGKGAWAVATNGSHTDPIAEKIDSGMNVRDALGFSLLALDFEHDSLDTPRIAAVVSIDRPVGYLGIVRRDAVLVREFSLRPGCAYYVSTYEKNRPADSNIDESFDAQTAADAAAYAIGGGVFADFEKPVCSAAALANGDKFDFGLDIVE